MSPRRTQVMEMEPHTPLNRNLGHTGWPVLLPSALEMTPPNSHARQKERSTPQDSFPGPPDRLRPSETSGERPIPPTPNSSWRQEDVNARASCEWEPGYVPPASTSAPAPKFATESKIEQPASATPATTISHFKEYKAYLTRQKRIPTTRAMVWSEDVEEAFMEGLKLIPRVGRRKITVAGRLRGRNELIADYIYKKTQQRRSRKQVSSHIQVLKHILKNDDKFLNLVADLPEGKETLCENITAKTFDDFIEKLKAMPAADFGDGTERTDCSPKAEPEIAHPVPAEVPSLLATPLRHSGHRPSSGSTTVVSNSSGSGSGDGAAPEWFASQLSTPPQRRGHHHRMASNSIDVTSEKVVPVSFKLAAEKDDQQHVFTRLIRPQLESPVRPHTFERISRRFPLLTHLRDTGEITEATPIIHGLVKLDVTSNPAKEPLLSTGDFSTDIQFLVWGTASSQLLASPARGGLHNRAAYHRVPNHMWQCVTTVASMGNTLLNVRDICTVREELLYGMERLFVPFTNDFWIPFLSGLYNSKGSPKATQNPDAAITAVTVMQSIYCCPNDAPPHIRFVVVYEFERAFDPFSARTLFRPVNHRTHAVKPPGIDYNFMPPHPQQEQNLGSPTSRWGGSSHRLERATNLRVDTQIAQQTEKRVPQKMPFSAHALQTPYGPFGEPPRTHPSSSPMVAPGAISQDRPFSGDLQDQQPDSQHDSRESGSISGDHHALASHIIPGPAADDFIHPRVVGNSLPRPMSSMAMPPLGAGQGMVGAMPVMSDTPLSASEASDFAAFSVFEGERITRSMTAFELPTWQDPDINDWYMFETGS